MKRFIGVIVESGSEAAYKAYIESERGRNIYRQAEEKYPGCHEDGEEADLAADFITDDFVQVYPEFEDCSEVREMVIAGLT